LSASFPVRDRSDSAGAGRGRRGGKGERFDKRFEENHSRTLLDNSVVIKKLFKGVRDVRDVTVYTLPIADSSRLTFFTVVVFAVFADIFNFHAVRTFVESHDVVYGSKLLESSEESFKSVFILFFGFDFHFFMCFYTVRIRKAGKAGKAIQKQTLIFFIFIF
jgi:hypothetical protein